MKFICGCNHSTPVEHLPTDAEGFVVCPGHGQRRYGWRSLPIDPVSGFQDYSFSHWTPLQIEKFMLYGVKPERSPFRTNTTTEDRRNNSDPQEIGRRIIARSNGKGQP